MKTIKKISRGIYVWMCHHTITKNLVSKKIVYKQYHILAPGKVKEQVAAFYEKKITCILVVFFATVAICIIAILTEEDTLSQGMLYRNNYNQGEKAEELLAKIPELDAEKDMEIILSERQYAEEQAKKYLQKVKLDLEKEILGENVALDEVSHNLNLVGKMNGYPVSIAWETSDDTIVNEDGEIIKEDIPEIGLHCTLTATLSCGEIKESLQYEICVKPPIRTIEEEVFLGLQKAIKEADEKQDEEITLVLPTEVQGYDIVYERKEMNHWLMFLLLGCVAMFMISAGMEKDLDKAIKERERCMKEEYPEMVSMFSMLICAGMTVKGAFQKIAYEYEETKVKQKKYLLEEMLYACRQMQCGTAEIKAYEQFGRRCGTSSCNKFSALLIQHVKKGSRGLSETLKQEAAYAMAEKKNGAKRLGEEASTKLLLPMGLMLVVVLVIIMVPAMFSFTV